MCPDRLIEEVEARIVEGNVVEVLANHQVRKKPAPGRNQIGPEERYLNGIAESVVVVLLRPEIACGSAEMNVPAVPIEARDICADLHARKSLMLGVGARRRRSAADSELQSSRRPNWRWLLRSLRRPRLLRRHRRPVDMWPGW